MLCYYRVLITGIVILGLEGCSSSYHMQCSRCPELVELELCVLTEEEGIPSVLTLEDMIERALACNLELRAREVANEIECEYANSERLGMLPHLLANFNRFSRNRNTGSSSVSLDITRPPAPPSVSREQHYTAWDYTLTWNLLDFGISYYRAMAQANRAVSQAWATEQAQHQIIEEVVEAYWKAVIARRGMEESENLIQKATQLGEGLNGLIAKQIMDTQEGLRLAKELMEMRIALSMFGRDYEESMNTLRLKMGLSPGQDFEPAEPRWEYQPQAIGDLEELDRMALSYRPELMAADSDEQAALADIQAEFVALFPSIVPEIGWNYDSNIYVLHHYWRAASIRVTQDLLSWPKRWTNYHITHRKTELVRAQRLSLGMAAVSQVHLAFVMLKELAKEYTLSLELQLVKQEHAEAITKQLRAGASDELETLIRQGAAVQAKIETFRVLGLLHIAEQRLNTAVGRPDYIWTDSVAEESLWEE